MEIEVKVERLIYSYFLLSGRWSWGKSGGKSGRRGGGIGRSSDRGKSGGGGIGRCGGMVEVDEEVIEEVEVE